METILTIYLDTTTQIVVAESKGYKVLQDDKGYFIKVPLSDFVTFGNNMDKLWGMETDPVEERFMQPVQVELTSLEQVYILSLAGIPIHRKKRGDTSVNFIEFYLEDFVKICK